MALTTVGRARAAADKAVLEMEQGLQDLRGPIGAIRTDIGVLHREQEDILRVLQERWMGEFSRGPEAMIEAVGAEVVTKAIREAHCATEQARQTLATKESELTQAQADRQAHAEVADAGTAELIRLQRVEKKLKLADEFHDLFTSWQLGTFSPEHPKPAWPIWVIMCVFVLPWLYWKHEAELHGAHVEIARMDASDALQSFAEKDVVHPLKEYFLLFSKLRGRAHELSVITEAQAKRRERVIEAQCHIKQATEKLKRLIEAEVECQQRRSRASFGMRSRTS